MAIQVFHKPELGNTLEHVENKVEVKLDNSGNVQLARTEAGLKATVVFPPQTVDVKLQGAEITAENNLKLTLTNGDVIETSLAKFVDAPKTAQEYWDEIKALPTFRTDLLDLLKGEEIQDFAGDTKGYLLPKA